MRVTDLLRGFGRTADFPAAADFLRATVDFSTVLVEDRLSRAGDPNVYPADEVPAMPADPATLKHDILQGRVRNVAGVVVSCCDGETVLVSR